MMWVTIGVLILVCGLVVGIAALSRSNGRKDAGEVAAEEGDAARRVRDEVEADIKRLPVDDLAERLSRWHRAD